MISKAVTLYIFVRKRRVFSTSETIIIDELIQMSLRIKYLKSVTDCLMTFKILFYLRK